jgi:hypothetical protein
MRFQELVFAFNGLFKGGAVGGERRIFKRFSGFSMTGASTGSGVISGAVSLPCKNPSDMSKV